jgi:hypothetical protein
MSAENTVTKRDADRWRWMAGTGAVLGAADASRLLDALEAARRDLDECRGRLAAQGPTADLLMELVGGRCWSCASGVRRPGPHFAPCREDRGASPNLPCVCPAWAFSAENARAAMSREREAEAGVTA